MAKQHHTTARQLIAAAPDFSSGQHAEISDFNSDFPVFFARLTEIMTQILDLSLEERGERGSCRLLAMAIRRMEDERTTVLTKIDLDSFTRGFEESRAWERGE